jgi:hypothetical protein
MAMLILGNNARPLPLGTVELGPYRLCRVAAEDPAIRAAYDPRWRLTDVFVLHPVRATLAWEDRVAKELAAQLASEVGVVREVELDGEPTPIAPPASVGDAPPGRVEELSGLELVAWLGRARLADGRVDPALLPPALPAGAVGARISLAPVTPGEIGELAAELRRRREMAPPDDYVDLLLEAGAPRVEWLGADGRGVAVAAFLHPREILARLDDFDSVDAVVPFYRDEDGLEVAFNPTSDPPDISLLEGDEADLVARAFSGWLAVWRAQLGVRTADVLRRAALPPRSADAIAGALRRAWRIIEAWVAPMHQDGERQGRG